MQVSPLQPVGEFPGQADTRLCCAGLGPVSADAIWMVATFCLSGRADSDQFARSRFSSRVKSGMPHGGHRAASCAGWR